jgi:hypothetical protein
MIIRLRQAIELFPKHGVKLRGGYGTLGYNRSFLSL